MPGASATQAPSRSSPPSSMAGCQHASGIRPTMCWMRSSTGNPKENSTPRVRQAATKAWVAPGGVRSQQAECLLPGGRRVLFLAERDADRGVEVDPQLTARLRRPPARHACWRAAARAARTLGKRASSIRSSSRHAVGIDATRPNSASRSRSTSIPVTASAPSAIATARSANTCPADAEGTPGRSPAALANPARQPRFRGQFPQQARPGVRHHAPPVRADLDPARPAATLHPRSAFR
jgi:hypothetical protein